jgi:ABC-type antimicrobial peptide transport system permease subunit
VLSGVFTLIALTLVIVGTFGVMSFQVGSRTREIGVRLALGAGNRQILRQILTRGIRLSLLGIGIGSILWLASARVLERMLFQVSPLNPVSILAMIILLLAVALAASIVPARRASRLDPVRALEVE